MKEHKTLEKVLAHLEEENKNSNKKRKYGIPDPYPYQDARELFKNPEVESDMSKLEVNLYKSILICYRSSGRNLMKKV
jgi:hypothetical protein